MKDLEKSASYPTSERDALSIRTQEYNLDLSRSTPVAISDSHRLKKDLKARHITMIAIGGALGTGLIIGTGAALAKAGPASIFIAYSFVGFIVYCVMCSIGEMATYIPLPSGFSGYAERYCDPALGFGVGYAYLCKFLIICPNQLTAGALVIQYWIPREKVNPGVWITIIFLLIIAINFFGVKFFGEFEFWLSSFKIVTIIGLMLLLFILMLGGGPTHDRLGFRYWKDPGAFKEYSGDGVHITGNTGKFVAWAAVLVTAVFAYLSTELVGVTVGEAENPRRNVPRAIKMTFYRIVFFYCISVLLLGCCVAYDDPELLSANKASTSASASPFVVAIANARIPYLPHIINAAILLFIISASNSDLYISSRTLYGLSLNNQAPEIFSRTNKRGVPVYSMLFCSLFCALAYMNCASSSATIFIYFVNVVSIFGLLTWISILVTHIFFMRALKAQGIDRHRDLVYRAPFAPYSTYFALTCCIVVALIKNFTVFIGEFDYKTFITGYIGIPVYLGCIFGYKIFTRCKRVKAEEADLFTFKDIVDAEEEEFLQKQAEYKLDRAGKRDLEWYYENSIGLLF
ncbi:hypothetical protein BABINDRAFT_9493 [Babjeviella inositovora NRRL Y-12698]|uniref:Amino acid permease/ SLC12A domain-containing protein n=1 Tax=Babjeviella inositovora NRRL Y-12698 TaxID=984486 RepID=A0A1E3QMQ1_9ASCO|nr:uncharacterized protein BABINDRAFT_9493 [Babjeviella inositovora NRRL Y-12698]ODQ78277.1 hypothetical protein BABINDRAFT_9493 [Babjeviella inositovora NRRL Y-12698]